MAACICGRLNRLRKQQIFKESISKSGSLYGVGCFFMPFCENCTKHIMYLWLFCGYTNNTKCSNIISTTNNTPQKGAHIMAKKLKEQLEFRKAWLENPEMNYTKEDFWEDWKEYQKTVEKAQYLELISESVYTECKHILMDYMDLFCR